MIKNLLICLIIFLSIATGYVLYHKIDKPPIGHINKNMSLPLSSPKQDEECIKIINEINENTSKIKNVTCDELIAYTWHFGLRLKLDGNLRHEKDKLFHMEISSVLGEEFLMGSNDKQFWFWSARLDPPALHYASHDDFHQTRLKSAFNPLMMMNSLGIQELKVGPKTVVKEQDAKIVMVEKLLDGNRQPIGSFTFIDKKRKRLIGHLVTDRDGEIIASSEILEYRNNLPYQIIYTWYEEDQAMLLELPNIKANVKIPESYWVKPDMKQEIDMGKTAVKLKWNFDELL